MPDADPLHFDYRATHVSTLDQSTAMLVSDLGSLVVLVNEEGFAWSDDPRQWKPIGEDLRVDPERLDTFTTGIYVRARGIDGKWSNADIADLDRASLDRWLRSRGGENEWAESVVRALLGFPRE